MRQLTVEFNSGWLLSFVLAASCGRTGAGTDIVGSGGDSATDGPVHVDASGPTCSDAKSAPSQACVDAGWFAMARWSTGRWPESESTRAFPPAPTQAVYLDAYAIDRQETTNEKYLAFLEATGAMPVPDDCAGTKQLQPDRSIPETSGWVGGRPPLDRLDHPVVCVTRSEAIAYCEWAGGTLPSVAQWLKAGSAEWPAVQPFPWGTTPPDPTASATAIDSVLPYMVFAKGGASDDALRTLPVGGHPKGRSRWGVDDLAGNVSEWLSSCREEIDLAYPATDTTLVRPGRDTPAKAECTKGMLFAGSSWASFHTHASASMTIFELPRAYLGSEADRPEWTDAVLPEETRSSTVSKHRSWQIGFRCVYPLRR